MINFLLDGGNLGGWIIIKDKFADRKIITKI